jgi:hypothetical protein
MQRLLGLIVLVSTAGLTACDGTGATSDLAAVGARPSASVASNVAHVSGSGTYSLAGSDVLFNYQAVQTPNGNANGTFHQFLDEGGGVTVDFDGAVTCVTFDAVNHRAWVGGVVTRNGSTDPDFLDATHQVGQDVWFRVLDNGGGNKVTDRTTFLGFVGAIASSADYCAEQTWPDGNARTWPVTAGHIHINP